MACQTSSITSVEYMSSITPALPSVLHSKLLPARHHRTWSVDRRHIQKIPMLHFIGKSPNKAALAKQTKPAPSRRQGAEGIRIHMHWQQQCSTNDFEQERQLPLDLNSVTAVLQPAIQCNITNTKQHGVSWLMSLLLDATVL